jgi:RNA polymerase sigma factor (sigma-70 family)
MRDRTGRSADDSARGRLCAALVRTGAGDRIAFHHVYVATSAKLFGVCVQMCEDPVVAEDVLHDVYVAVWLRAGSYRPGRASPISWLAMIARNKAIDWRRRQVFRHTLAIEDAPPLIDTAPLVSESMIVAEAHRHLRDSLQRLDERKRDAIVAIFFEGRSYADVALLHDMPICTVKSLVRRGLARMRTDLDRTYRNIGVPVQQVE